MLGLGVRPLWGVARPRAGRSWRRSAGRPGRIPCPQHPRPSGVPDGPVRHDQVRVVRHRDSVDTRLAARRPLRQVRRGEHEQPGPDRGSRARPGPGPRRGRPGCGPGRDGRGPAVTGAARRGVGRLGLGRRGRSAPPGLSVGRPTPRSEVAADSEAAVPHGWSGTRRLPASPLGMGMAAARRSGEIRGHRSRIVRRHAGNEVPLTNQDQRSHRSHEGHRRSDGHEVVEGGGEADLVGTDQGVPGPGGPERGGRVRGSHPR